MKKISNKKLAKMWCELNRFGCPKEFERYSLTSKQWSYQVMLLIEGIIGKRECLAQWNREQIKTK